MNCVEFKNLLRKYVGDAVDTERFEDLFDEYNDGYEYIHSIVFLIDRYPNLNDYLEEYLKTCNNINVTNTYGETMLFMATHYSISAENMVKTIKMLIDAGIDVNVQNDSGKTALHHIQSNEVIKLFLDAGIDIFNIKDDSGKSVCDYMTKENKKYFGIDEATLTIGYLTGKLTKSAIKK